MASRSSSGVVSAQCQVVIFVHNLAGAQYPDLMLCYAVACSTVYNILVRVRDAVLTELPLPETPETEEE